jgi:transposase
LLGDGCDQHCVASQAVRNPSGRPKKVSQELDPGMVLQSIDSEEIVVVEKGKRRRMTKVEIDFRQQFVKTIRGDLKAARLIANTAAKYFAERYGMSAALTDALGHFVRFVLLPGQRFDTVGVPPLIEGLAFDALIADKAFDSNATIAELDARGAKVVISQHPRRAKPLAIDEEMYKWRHLIENFFGRLKEFKRIAMRADKTDQSFASMIHLAAAVINSR